ncbi:MAG: HAMP domain-containing histidine kinase [Sphingobacteriales bacterium]|nr:HAMP domain-containing histidine kinase [Sphingobacteriales bacterium]
MKHLKLKIIISVYLCLITLALHNAFHAYYSNINQAKQATLTKLSTISNILAQEINGDRHERITHKYLKKNAIINANSDQDYQKIHELLAKTKVSAEVNSPIYTLFPSTDKKTFYFGVTSSETPYFRHSYHSPPQELINNYQQGGSIDEYQDENGIWLSYFAPIKNSKGETVAVVQTDENFNDFMASVKFQLIENIVIVILIYSAIGILLYFFLKEVLKQEDAFIKTQQNYNTKLSEEVEVRTSELNVLNTKLKAVNNELSSFFYSTSHDIRGPLCRILGLSSLAKDEEDKQGLVELIEIESQKMDNMLKKMILVNNLRTKNLDIEPLSVADTVNNILSQMNKKYYKTKAEINIRTETQSLNQFNSDKEILQSIISHLLDNAFKFSDGVHPKININSFIDKNGILSLTVANNGLRFSEKEKTHAFELFKNANNNGDAEGIRLGLYTIKTSVDKLNGLVDIEEENEMTVLKVLIPDFYIIKNADLNSCFVGDKTIV